MKRTSISTCIKAAVAVCLLAAISLPISSLSANEEDHHPSSNAAPEKGNFVEGARLWAKTCQRCHNMRDPKELDDSQWSAVVTHMRLRAGLTGQDARDILAFLQQSNDK